MKRLIGVPSAVRFESHVNKQGQIVAAKELSHV
jgi:hypothetical protein